ncbi:hypothetical protein [Herbiconiux solani]|uniref:hypothetical protein n=1 Tax=Herbiconiux solani TaxID=661329 RepID=UPI000825B54A|nr:hypothetical protein [Herbiconiux solani]
MSSLFLRSRRAAGRGAGRRRPWSAALGIFAGASVFGLAALTALAPPPMVSTGDAEAGSSSTSGSVSADAPMIGTSGGQPMVGAQSVTVSEGAVAAAIARDEYASTPGVQTLAAGSTNRDWAQLVLLLGGFPMTDSNITVMLRWMRQENGPESWYLRNNPLNNGWGSGGGSGLGSYDNLVTAAANVGNALHGNSGYRDIVAGFMESAPTSQIEAAIWASPWASSHYANGSHWAYTPVTVVSAPKDAWG